MTSTELFIKIKFNLKKSINSLLIITNNNQLKLLYICAAEYKHKICEVININLLSNYYNILN